MKIKDIDFNQTFLNCKCLLCGKTTINITTFILECDYCQTLLEFNNIKDKIYWFIDLPDKDCSIEIYNMQIIFYNDIHTLRLKIIDINDNFDISFESIDKLILLI